MLFNKQITKKLDESTKELKQNDKDKLVSGINNQILKDFIFKKIDAFYDDIISYTRSMILPRKITNEIKLYDNCQFKGISHVINNFNEIRQELKNCNSNFYSASFLYAFKINENKSPINTLYLNIMATWEECLIEKVLNYRMFQLESTRRKAKRLLYNRIQIIKKRKQILNVFPNYFDFFWHTPSNRMNKIKLNNILKYGKYLYSNPTIQAIARQIGRKLEKDRIKAITVTKEKITRIWLPDGKEEIYGVYESDDLEHLLPSEIVYFKNKLLFPIFLKKFAEKKLYSFEYWQEKLIFDKVIKRDFLKKGSGDVIICVDTSLSMAGPHEYIAKVIALAIIRYVLDDDIKRKCILINFSENFRIFNTLDIENAPLALESFLEEAFHGGTNLDGALFEAIKYMEASREEYKNCDVLMISDFNAPQFSQLILNKMTFQRQYYNEFHAIQIGTEGNDKITKEFKNCWVYNPKDAFTSQKILKLLVEYNDNYKGSL